jgi:hypothetical protein
MSEKMTGLGIHLVPVVAAAISSSFSLSRSMATPLIALCDRAHLLGTLLTRDARTVSYHEA